MNNCWKCNGTGSFGGVDGTLYECDHPPDTREYTKEGYLIMVKDSYKDEIMSETTPLSAIAERTCFEPNKTYLVDGEYYQEQSDKYGKFITIDGNRWEIKNE